MSEHLIVPVVIDDEGQRSYEQIVADRLPGIDAAAWSLFTYALGAGRRAEAFLGDVARRHGLDGAQFSVLVVLWMNGPPHRLSPTKLSRFIAQSPSGMTHTVKRLTAAGLVSRPGLESDGRAKHVELTDEGLETVRRCSTDLAEAIEGLFADEDLPVEELTRTQRRLVNVFTAQVDG